jgi:UDP-N-acetylmuramate--alanine ligase
MKRIHFLGINGSGMAGVACLAKTRGFEVGGCDLSESGNYSKQLQELNIEIKLGHSPAHLEDTDMLVVSPAVFFDDKYKQIDEIMETVKKGVLVLKWQAFLDQFLVKDEKFIAICGTHGKTSTTTITANLLDDLGLDPTVIIGGINPRYGKTFRDGRGKYFVCEADEYGNNFHCYHPNYIIFNNIEMEHPEYFSDYDGYESNFIKFFSNLKNDGTIVFNYDDENSLKTILQAKDILLSKNAKVVGFSSSSQVSKDPFIRIKNYEVVGNSSFVFDGLKHDMKNLKGIHNIRNVVAVLTLFCELGLNKNLKKYVENAILPARRMELVLKNDKIRLFDDYAHHHTQIYYNLTSLAEERTEKKKIIAIVEPHLISRFKQNSEKYLDFMEISDYPIITKFFKSREASLPDLPMEGYLKNRKVVYIEDFDEVVKKVGEIINLPENQNIEFDIVVMGAGNSYKLTNTLKNFYAEK